MTVNEMLALLGYNLDDPNEGRYTSAIKLAALNAEQDQVASVADTGLLRALQTSYNFQGQSTGNSLPSDYFRYVNSKLRSVSPVKWILKVDVDDIEMVDDNRYTRGSSLDPQCYIWGNTYYLLIDSGDYSASTANVALYYIKTVTAMTAGGSSEFHHILHKPLVMLAEAGLRNTYKYGSPEESVKMVSDAYALINEANAKYRRGEL